MTFHSRAVDTLLAEYAAGLVSSPLRALVDAHLELNAQARPFLADLERLGGVLLEEADPVALSDRDGMLASIFDADDIVSLSPRRHTFSTAVASCREPAALPSNGVARAKPMGSSVLPPSLERFIGGGIDSIKWRTVMPGLKECRIDTESEEEVNLLWIRAGQAVPTHTHDGNEITLVLAGGFEDATGHYVRGDIAIADEDVDHRPVADRDEDCICFAVLNAPVRLSGRFGRLVQPFIR